MTESCATTYVSPKDLLTQSPQAHQVSPAEETRNFYQLVTCITSTTLYIKVRIVLTFDPINLLEFTSIRLSSPPFISLVQPFILVRKRDK